MLKVSICIVTAMTFVASALAAGSTKIKDNEDVTFIVPAGSPVGKAKIGEYGVVEYEGRIMVSGKYEYGYSTDDSEEADNYGEKYLSFTLDKQTVAKLPYWSRDGQDTNELGLMNPEDFAKAVIPANLLARLNTRKIKSVNGTATIWIEDFQTSVECDHDNFYAKFSSLVNRNQIASNEFAENESC
jgi:hypothetical protein